MASRLSFCLILLVGRFKAAELLSKFSSPFPITRSPIFYLHQKAFSVSQYLVIKGMASLLYLLNHLSIAVLSCLAWQPPCPLTLNQCDLNLSNFLHEFTDSLEQEPENKEDVTRKRFRGKNPFFFFQKLLGRGRTTLAT